MPEKSSSTSPSVSQIFRSMSYDEEQPEDLSPIYTWLSPCDTISSILNGEWTKPPNSDTSDRNRNLVVDLEKTRIRVELASPELLEHSLQPDSSSTEQENQPTHTDFVKRLEQLRDLVKSNRRILSLLESFATKTPVWQVLESDERMWEQAINQWSLVESPGEELRSNLKMLLIPLNLATYSFLNIISSVLIPALQSDGKFQVILSIRSAQDAAAALPIAYALDAINKSKMRKSPVDLLLLDRSCEKSVQVLKGKSGQCPILVRGESWSELELELELESESESHLPPLPLHLLSGDLSSVSGVKGIHFIVDSSADVQTAAEAISAIVWTSGRKVQSGARSLLLVHQSVYKGLMEAVEKKMSRLKISTDFTLKMADFIRRPLPSSIHAQKVLGTGAKVFPEASDLSSPSLVYDIGTSSPLIAGATPQTGHILALISYRNTNELVQLSNNLDHGNQVYIYATDISFVKQTAAGLKGKEVWLNRGSCPASDVDRRNRSPIAILRDRISGEEEELLNSTGNRSSSTANQLDKWMAVVGGAEKCLKSWSSLSISRRSALLQNILLSGSLPADSNPNPNERDGNGSGVSEFQSLLINIAGRIEDCGNSDSGDLAARVFRPCGSVVILFLGTGAGLNRWTRLMPVLLSALKGNVTSVISSRNGMNKEEREEEDSIRCVIQSTLPVGVVNFIELGSVSSVEAVAAVSGAGKTNVLWLIGDDADSALSLRQIPLTAFQRVLIDTGNLSKTQMSQRASQLETKQTIHF